MATDHRDWKAWLADGRVGPFSATIAFVGLYCLMQVAVLTLLVRFAGTGVGIDDAEQLVYLPYLWAGYGGSQPPLYTWINHLAASVLGINVLTLKLVKYACLFGAAWCVQAAMRQLGLKSATAGTAALGLFLIPMIVWESQRALSHSVAALCFSALAVFAFARLHARRTTMGYVVFGLAVAASILGKYNDLVLVGALLAAALSLRELRGVILDRRFVLTIIVTCLSIAPTFVWNVRNPDELLARTNKFGISPERQFWQAALEGGHQIVASTFYFSLLPLAVLAIAAVITWRAPVTVSAPTAAEKLLWRTLGAGAAVVAVFVLAAGATEVRDRWLLPVLFLLPAAVAASMERFGEWGRAAQLATIRGVVIVLAMLTPALWYVQIYTGDGLGRIARLDYAALRQEMLATGPVATVLSDKLWIGNLRLTDPALVLLGEEVPDYASLIREPAVLTWLDGAHPSPAFMQSLAAKGFSKDGAETMVGIPEKVGGGTRQVGFVRLKRIAGGTDGSS